MIQVDLTSDVGENTYKLTDWQLLVDGEPFDYGGLRTRCRGRRPWR